MSYENRCYPKLNGIKYKLTKSTTIMFWRKYYCCMITIGSLQVSWFIIDMAQWSSHQNESKDIEGLGLFGLLILSKRLTLEVVPFIFKHRKRSKTNFNFFYKGNSGFSNLRVWAGTLVNFLTNAVHGFNRLLFIIHTTPEQNTNKKLNSA